MSRRTIYLDMDGVLADFDRAMVARGVHAPSFEFGHLPEAEWTQEQIRRDAQVRVEMAKPDFWPSLPIMPGARELLAVAAKLAGTAHLFILTATPRSNPEQAAFHKREWAAKHLGFPAGRVLTCLRSEKRLHAAPGKILVDDLASNCAEWREAGGVAVHYADAPSAIGHLMEHFLG